MQICAKICDFDTEIDENIGQDFKKSPMFGIYKGVGNDYMNHLPGQNIRIYDLCIILLLFERGNELFNFPIQICNHVLHHFIPINQNPLSLRAPSVQRTSMVVLARCCTVPPYYSKVPKINY